MKKNYLKIKWPNGLTTYEQEGISWLKAAKNADQLIPTGCLNGSCGACEIEVNGKVIRACVSNIHKNKETLLHVELFYDPYW